MSLKIRKKRREKWLQKCYVTIILTRLDSIFLLQLEINSFVSSSRGLHNKFWFANRVVARGWVHSDTGQRFLSKNGGKCMRIVSRVKKISSMSIEHMQNYQINFKIMLGLTERGDGALYGIKCGFIFTRECRKRHFSAIKFWTFEFLYAPHTRTSRSLP